jgi:hypothetical protein
MLLSNNFFIRRSFEKTMKMTWSEITYAQVDQIKN